MLGTSRGLKAPTAHRGPHVCSSEIQLQSPPGAQGDYIIRNVSPHLPALGKPHWAPQWPPRRLSGETFKGAEGSWLGGCVPEGIWEKRLQACVHRGGPGGFSGEERSERKQSLGWGEGLRRQPFCESPERNPGQHHQPCTGFTLPGPPEAADVTTNNPSLCVGVGRGRDRLNSSFSGCANRVSPTKRSSQGTPPSTLTGRPSWWPLAWRGGGLLQ